jgi:hypothetical protein
MRIQETLKKFIVPYMIRVAEKQNEERIFQLYRFGTCFVKTRRYQCIGRSTKGKRRLN